MLGSLDIFYSSELLQMFEPVRIISLNVCVVPAFSMVSERTPTHARVTQVCLFASTLSIYFDDFAILMFFIKFIVYFIIYYFLYFFINKNVPFC